MRDETVWTTGQVPVRVVLRGEPDGWHYVVAYESGAEERSGLPAEGTRWRAGPHRDEAAPAWWHRQVADDAAALRERVGMTLTDRCFEQLGAEADITWFAVEEPAHWEGIVTLQAPDPARFPGEVPPFVVILEPGRGALLPGSSLPFGTAAENAWTALADVARRYGAPAPASSFICGLAGHRSVRVGRGSLAISTEHDPDGVERVCGVHGKRITGWAGNPPLRLRFEGVDLLDEPAEDVLWLLAELGHAHTTPGDRFLLPSAGLTLWRPDGSERFTEVTMYSPDFIDRPR